MGSKLMFALGLGVGYVLGTKAGRERYEQIVRTSQNVTQKPQVQNAAETVRTKATQLAQAAKQKVQR